MINRISNPLTDRRLTPVTKIIRTIMPGVGLYSDRRSYGRRYKTVSTYPALSADDFVDNINLAFLKAGISARAYTHFQSCGQFRSRNMTYANVCVETSPLYK